MEYPFRHEYERHLKIAVVGCGGHAYRNILPALSYLPVQLLATCDLDAGRAEAYARTFGARRAFASFDDLLEWAPEGGVEAVLLLLSLRDGRPQYRDFVLPALERGLHVWMEKPPAATAGEVQEMQGAQRRSGRVVQVGYKHYFFPALVRAREIIDSPEFGGASSMSATYPLRIAPEEQRRDPARNPINLDLCHAASAIHLLMGDVDSLWFDRAPNGGGIACLRFVSGAVGVLHCTSGQVRHLAQRALRGDRQRGQRGGRQRDPPDPLPPRQARHGGPGVRPDAGLLRPGRAGAGALGAGV